LDVGFDFSFLVGGEFVEFRDEVVEVVVKVHIDFGERGGVFGDEVFEEDVDGMVEDDGIVDFYYGGFYVEGEEYVIGFCFGDLLFEEGDEGFLVYLGGVHDFVGFEGEFGEECLGVVVFFYEFNFDFSDIIDGY
jgi:hypothetical protein